MTEQLNTCTEMDKETEMVTIWTQQHCPLCEQVKQIIGEGNYEERHAAELLSGADADIEAMAQLAMQNMELPMIKMQGAFISPRDLLARNQAA